MSAPWDPSVARPKRLNRINTEQLERVFASEWLKIGNRPVSARSGGNNFWRAAAWAARKINAATVQADGGRNEV
jgi:hypothetical protein